MSHEESRDLVEAPCPFCQRLATSPHMRLRQLCVARSGDCVTLTGVVGSYYEKQLAQECVRQLLGALTLINAVEVRDRG